MTDETSIDPTEEERAAWGRLAFTADGLLAHRSLRRVLERIWPTTEGGALNRHEGQRMLARDLMALMADGVDSRRERTSSADAPLAPARRRGAPVIPASGTRRRGAPVKPGDGWSPDPDDAPAS